SLFFHCNSVFSIFLFISTDFIRQTIFLPPKIPTNIKEIVGVEKYFLPLASFCKCPNLDFPDITGLF
ncbi:MAG: hypothetical protein LBH80_06015, partial [Prevotellaceae bacterium]|nr:hypothetical protein [Prevotellaceae bacterium]